MSKPILHIGFPKTATTWFQKDFYPFVSNASFIDRARVSDLIIFPETVSYNPTEVKQSFQNKSGNKRLLICEELLLGGLDISYGSGEFVTHIANRLKATFNDASIVIFIRNQHDILESAYSHYIKSGGTYSINKFLGINERLPKKFQNHQLFNPALFNYYNIIELYTGLFGRENVHVFLYEDFVENRVQFIRNFFNYLDLEVPVSINYEVKENVRLSSFSVGVLRFFNHFTHRNTPFKNYFLRWNSLYPWLISISKHIDNLGFARRKPFKFDNSVHQWINQYYRENNALLENFVSPEKLKKYNYPR